LFDYDALIRQALVDPDQVWSALDSFWRERTDLDTEDLVHYQSWASTLLFLNTHAKANHYLKTQTVPEIEAFLRQPWFPIVLYQDRIVNQSTYVYGDPFQYDPTPQIYYGQQSGTPRYIYPLPQELLFVADIPIFVDAVTDTTVEIDQTQFTYDPATGEIVFTVDPFTLIPAKTSTDGRDYIVLWVRNVQLDIDMPFDQVGWVVKYDRASFEGYAETLRQIWDLVLRGPSLGRYKKGLMDALGFPYALSGGQITRIESDGYQWVISTADKSYTSIAADTTPIVQQGDEVIEGQPLTDGIEFFEYPDLLTTTSAQLSGLLLDIPLSNGVVAPLSFANIDTAWDFSAGRPSEWRFPVGGDPVHVEQFWVDVDAYATANSIVFATIYSLPAAVNPMKRIIEDLFHNSLFVASVDLSTVSDDPGGFADRARLLLPTDVLIVLQQNLDPISDSFDLGVTSSETVGYGYNAAIPDEDLSITGSGTSLEYTDYAPLVVTW
jgi:hypothetical protein